MSKSTISRVIPANHFVAESLEEEANRLPPSQSVKAKTLREHAATLRSISSAKMVRVWEEKEDVGQASVQIVEESTERE